MKRIFMYIVAGSVTFLGFIMAFAPASLLYSTVEAELDKVIPEVQLALAVFRVFPLKERSLVLEPEFSSKDQCAIKPPFLM